MQVPRSGHSRLHCWQRTISTLGSCRSPAMGTSMCCIQAQVVCKCECRCACCCGAAPLAGRAMSDGRLGHSKITFLSAARTVGQEMYAGNSASGKDPCDDTPASILQVNMAEVETKISFVLKLMLSMFGVPKAAACFADNQVWQQTAKGLEEADGAAWRPFTSAVMQCETDELLSVDDTQQDHRSAVAGLHNCCFLLLSGKG